MNIFLKFNKQITDFHESNWIGLKIKIINRLSLLTVKRKISLLKNKEAILIINGAERTVSEIHRVKHLEDKLKILNFPYLSLTKNMLNLLNVEDLHSFSLIFIHRSDLSQKILELIHIYKNEKKPILYDIDDLVFDKDKFSELEFLNIKSSKIIKDKFYKTVEEQLMLMKKASAIVVPTNFLANYIEKKYKLRSYVLRNHLDSQSLEKGKEIFENNNNRRDKREIVLGYFPGTKTHEQDFNSIENVLIDILDNYSQVKIQIVGELDLARKLKNYHGRIIRLPRQPYHKLMKAYKDCDINLAPLEFNDFCQAKSELKYIFAAAAGIPTVASATDSFSFAIKNGVNGFLCRSEAEWLTAIENLINDGALRKRMGKNAYLNCQQHYTPQHQATELKMILSQIMGKNTNIKQK